MVRIIKKTHLLRVDYDNLYRTKKNAVTHIDGALHENANLRIGIAVGRFNGFFG